MTWRECEDVPEALREPAVAVLVDVHAGLVGLRRGAQWRERLAWESLAGVRRTLMQPAAPDGTTGTDTDSGSTPTATDSTDTDSGSTDTDIGSTDTDTTPADTDIGSTDTDTTSVDTDTDSTTGGTDGGSGTSTGGDPEPPPAPSGWTFAEGAYVVVDEDVRVDASWIASEPSSFASPGETLIADLRTGSSYLLDHEFVPTDHPDPEALPIAGRLTFSSAGPYLPLLGLGESLQSPYAVLRSEFVNFLGFEADTNYEPTDTISADTAVEVAMTTESGAWVELSSTAEAETLRDLFLGTTSAWEIDAFAIDTASGQDVELTGWQISYQGFGSEQVFYPDEPNYTINGSISGELTLRVTGGAFDYDVTLLYATDGDGLPEAIITCL